MNRATGPGGSQHVKNNTTTEASYETGKANNSRLSARIHSTACLRTYMPAHLPAYQNPCLFPVCLPALPTYLPT